MPNIKQSHEKTVQCSLSLPVTAPHAFRHFTEGMHVWWPAAYTWSQEVLKEIGIEPGVNGRCYERGPYNFSCDWGRVLVWEPPYRLVFTWQISPQREPVPDPAQASEVEVRFVPQDPSNTQVQLEHRYFDRHGENGAAYQTMLASPEGWPYILDSYAKSVQEKVEA